MGVHSMNINIEIYQEGFVTPTVLCNALQSINHLFKEH